MLWKFSLPLALSGVLVGPVRWTCNAFLVNKPDGYSEMGILTAGLVFQTLLLFVSNMLHAPVLSILCHTGDAKSKQLETVNILISWILGLFPAIPLLCFPEIVELLFGGGYKGRTFRMTFALIVFYTCILTFRSGLLRVLISRSLNWWGLGNNLVWAVTVVPSAWYLSQWGAVGLAASFAIAYVSCSVFFMPVYMKQCNVPRYFLVSKEVAIVWLVLIVLVIMSFCHIPLLYRILVMPISFYLTGFALKTLWDRGTQVTGENGERN